MPDITLTTDWSDKGYTRGLIKGLLISRFPHSRIFDICHSVDPFDIKQAAFLLKTAHSAFPSGTIHIACVLPHYSHENEIVFFEKNGHFFIGPNNGLFSLVFEDVKRAGSIPIKYRDEYPVIRALSNGVARILKPDPGELELEIELNQKLLIQPVVSPDTLRAVVNFVDHFGNLTLNIDEKLFREAVGKRNFSIYFKNHEPLREISRHYMDVPYGEVLCRFNSSGHLEIAANNFSAAELLDLKVGDAVHLELK